jgi:hypothetical protein
MAGVDFALGGTTLPVTAQMERLQAALSTFDLRVTVGRSRMTGQPVIRLVDGRTGQPSGHLPGAAARVLAGLAADAVAPLETR